MMDGFTDPLVVSTVFPPDDDVTVSITGSSTDSSRLFTSNEYTQNVVLGM